MKLVRILALGVIVAIGVFAPSVADAAKKIHWVNPYKPEKGLAQFAHGTTPGTALAIYKQDAPEVSQIQTTTSENWAGYVVEGGGAPVHDHFVRIRGVWNVPLTDCSVVPNNVNAASSQWLGLDGSKNNSQTVEQAGSKVECNTQQGTVYYLWWEMFPDFEKPVMLVDPGDVISVSIRYHPVRQDYHIVVIDQTLRKGFKLNAQCADNTRSITCRNNSVEAITEAPSESNQQVLLPNYQRVQYHTLQVRDFSGFHNGMRARSHWKTIRLLEAVNNNLLSFTTRLHVLNTQFSTVWVSSGATQ